MMMQEVSSQGKSEEEVKKMITKENFEKYRLVLFTMGPFRPICFLYETCSLWQFLTLSDMLVHVYMYVCPVYREIALPATLRTLKLGVATAQVAEKESLEVDPLDLQDQMDLRRLEAERQGMDEKVRQ